jgi:hypothetical protein
MPSASLATALPSAPPDAPNVLKRPNGLHAHQWNRNDEHQDRERKGGERERNSISPVLRLPKQDPQSRDGEGRGNGVSRNWQHLAPVILHKFGGRCQRREEACPAWLGEK